MPRDKRSTMHPTRISRTPSELSETSTKPMTARTGERLLPQPAADFRIIIYEMVLYVVDRSSV